VRPADRRALRLWDDDGALRRLQRSRDPRRCDALSPLLYWPTHGWVIVAGAGTRAQLVTDSGGMSWGADEADRRALAPPPRRSPSPPLPRRRRSCSCGTHAVAASTVTPTTRWRSATTTRARPQKSARRSISARCGYAVAPGQERITLTRTADGVLRATLAAGQVGSARTGNPAVP
jgi:hypothetical protein